MVTSLVALLTDVQTRASGRNPGHVIVPVLRLVERAVQHHARRVVSVTNSAQICRSIPTQIIIIIIIIIKSPPVNVKLFHSNYANLCKLLCQLAPLSLSRLKQMSTRYRCISILWINRVKWFDFCRSPLSAGVITNDNAVINLIIGH